MLGTFVITKVKEIVENISWGEFEVEIFTDGLDLEHLDWAVFVNLADHLIIKYLSYLHQIWRKQKREEERGKIG